MVKYKISTTHWQTHGAEAMVSCQAQITQGWPKDWEPHTFAVCIPIAAIADRKARYRTATENDAIRCILREHAARWLSLTPIAAPCPPAVAELTPQQGRHLVYMRDGEIAKLTPDKGRLREEARAWVLAQHIALWGGAREDIDVVGLPGDKP